MAVDGDAVAHASAMGARAGEAFAETGVPAPNPFDHPAGGETESYPDLAAAWRRAYFDALPPPRIV